MPVVQSLNGSNWLFKGYYGEDWRWRRPHQPGSREHRRGWLPASVPGSVLHDLWQAGQIPTPYFEQNSLLSEWACQRTWLYRTSFRPEAALCGQRVRLVFEGVDYSAEFFLNGTQLGEHASMYTPAAFEVTELLKFDEDNLLCVVIAAAPQEQPQVGRTSRVRTHKARMNYWWDFCPRLVHQGIWQAVSLQASGPARLEDVWVRPQLAEDLQRAVVQVECRVSNPDQASGSLRVTLRQDGQAACAEAHCDLRAGETNLRLEIALEQPQLWWPNGYGSQPLYTAAIELQLAGAAQPSDMREVSFGVRRLRLVANHGAPAQALPYTLEVNGQRIYINGWNWVPLDALYGVERPARLAHLLGLAARAGANLLRVWGGGLIEKEAFYELCDRLGLLVWQEFIQSSSGIENTAPSDPDFIAWMVDEARQVIPLRRNHASLALWCGGNELMDADGRPLTDNHPMLGALHELVEAYDPGRAWLPTSSSGPVFAYALNEIAKDPAALHDVHGPWEYQGLEEQYTLYNRGASLLHSEFGVEGLANRATLDSVIAPAHQLPVSLDNPLWFHLGAWWVREEPWQRVFGAFTSVEQAVQGVQFLQYEGLRYALQADRRRWPRNSGTCPWQFNEPFPMAACTSAVDYYGRPKPGYYAVAEAYRPLQLSARYERLAWAGHTEFSAELWASHNGAGPAVSGRLCWRVQDLAGQVLAEGDAPAEIAANTSQRLAEARCPLPKLPGDLFFLSMELHSPTGGPLAQARVLFSAAADLKPIFQLPSAQVSAAVSPAGAQRTISLRNLGEHAALYLWLESASDPQALNFALFDRNYFCLLPGESAVVHTSSSPALRLSGWNIPSQRLK